MFPGETVLSQKAIGMESDPHTSDFKVIRSGGGWYIGTMFLACGEGSCKDCQDYAFGDRVLVKGQELDYGSRETDYFDTEAEANEALNEYKETGNLPGMRY